MKRRYAAALAAFWALAVMGEPLDLQMPFKKGRKVPVAFWTGGMLIDDGGNAVSLQGGSGIKFKRRIPGKAGDKLVFEITSKRKKGNVSLRIGQWAKEGWIGENPAVIKGGSDYSVAKGEIILRDASQPDKNGVMRKLSHFDITLWAHKDSDGVVIKDVKIDFVAKE